MTVPVEPQSFTGRKCAGPPFHGVVVDGTLTLPNSGTMAYTDPDNPDTFRFKGPHSWTPNRSAGDITDDTTNGYQWLDYAILAGSGFQYAGSNIGGWMWTDSAGNNWKVTTTLTAQDPGTTPINATVTFTKWGMIGAAAETHTVNISISDIQQTGFASLRTEGDGGDIILLCDVSPDGSKAAFVMGLSGSDFIRTYSLGFLEITLSGSGSGVTASLAVARSRTQTLGNYTTGTNVITPGNVLFTGGDHTQEVIDGKVIDTTTLTAETGDGINSTAGVSTAWYVENGKVVDTFAQLADRIIWIEYDDDNTLQEVTLRLKRRRTEYRNGSMSASGQRVANLTDNICIEESSTFSSDYAGTRFEIGGEIELKVGGVSAGVHTLGAVSWLDVSISKAPWYGGSPCAASGDWVWDWERRHQIYGGGKQWVYIESGSGSAASPGWPAQNTTTGSAARINPKTGTLSINQLTFNSASISVNASDGVLARTLAIWFVQGSNKVWGARCEFSKHNDPDGTNEVTPNPTYDYEWFTSHGTTLNKSHSSTWAHASAHPATFEIAAENSTVPVCWV